MMQDIVLAFIPMFFAMDPIGILPLFVGLTEGVGNQQRQRIVVQSLITATVVAVGFMMVGTSIFALLGISMGDFMIAGGLILFCLSIVDLLGSNKRQGDGIESLGAVPIGTPLIVGPAVLTMSLILIAQHGLVATLIAVILNLILVGIVFRFSDFFIRLIGPSGSRALSKVLMLLLAAIGVMLVRRGIIAILTNHPLP